MVQEFIKTFEATARNYECWRGVSGEELEQSSEALELFITREKHKYEARRKLFVAEMYDIAKDQALQAAYRRYSAFLQARHLEISEELVNEGWVQIAISRRRYLELRKIADYTSPRDKLICVSNCYRVVSSTGYTEIIEASSFPSGADVTLPLFMYVVLKSRAEQLFRNYYFIKKFRYQLRRETRDPVEFRYTLTTLKIAIRFIAELTPDKLKLEPGEVVPQIVVERKHASVQTSKANVDLEDHLPLQYTGPVDVAYLSAHPEALQVLLADFSRLRDYYARK